MDFSCLVVYFEDGLFHSACSYRCQWKLIKWKLHLLLVIRKTQTFCEFWMPTWLLWLVQTCFWPIRIVSISWSVKEKQWPCPFVQLAGWTEKNNPIRAKSTEKVNSSWAIIQQSPGIVLEAPPEACTVHPISSQILLNVTASWTLPLVF